MVAIIRKGTSFTSSFLSAELFLHSNHHSSVVQEEGHGSNFELASGDCEVPCALAVSFLIA